MAFKVKKVNIFYSLSSARLFAVFASNRSKQKKRRLVATTIPTSQTVDFYQKQIRKKYGSVNSNSTRRLDGRIQKKITSWQNTLSEKL